MRALKPPSLLSVTLILITTVSPAFSTLYTPESTLGPLRPPSISDFETSCSLSSGAFVGVTDVGIVVGSVTAAVAVAVGSAVGTSPTMILPATEANFSDSLITDC